ncbi:LysR family transcriptional regulator [Marivivens marinus]|uniref:LysR family transcriptional regulator n=1 Tax=Marivivens marinus TaxID=3110173 RepID=UPI003B8459DA
MERSPLSLKWLEAFQAVARHGTLSDGAQGLGVSVSTVSHHLTCLEQALGTPLLDHAKRPMRLTPAGETLLRRVDEAMWLLRMGVSDLWSGDLASVVRLLRIAHLEDFDTDVAPALVQHLSAAMPRCDFSMLSRPSHEVVELLETEQVDVGIAAAMDRESPGLIEEPILRDPFILVTPRSLPGPAPDLTALQGQADALPLLRYSRKQQIGRRIEAQLRRLGARFPQRMEFESTHAILAMVAAGRGWTITTALTFARAQRYHGDLCAAPFPGRAFSRTIALICREDLPAPIRTLIETGLRGAVQRQVIDQTVARYPWLAGRFEMLGAG